jgi:DNA-binding NarL/FixJ family response regulator
MQAGSVDPAAMATLTPTQLKVLRGVHSGQLNKQIAWDLGIAEATVKAHMTALMRKLNVRNRTQVAMAAQNLAQQPHAG